MGEVLVDRYEIRESLGKKAGRQTLLAWDQNTETLVVIKLLSFSQEFAWDDLKLFEREAETLRSLSHPLIPRYLDFFELELANAQGFALVQSYVEGQSLEDCLRSGHNFSEPEVKQVARSLLEILTYLHTRQPPVIHRDIKPSNILLHTKASQMDLPNQEDFTAAPTSAAPNSSRSQLYLVDFGSVQTLAAKEGSTITVVGTYGYMPPEQFGGRTSAASDLYSLGATLIYLVTGKHPADIPQKQLRLQFEPLVNLSPALVRWLARLVEPGLDQRFAAAETALQHLDRLYLTTQLIGSPAKLTLGTIVKPKTSKVELSKSDKQLTIRFSLPFAKSLARSQQYASPQVNSLSWVIVGLGLSFTAIHPLFLLMLLVPLGLQARQQWQLRSTPKRPSQSVSFCINQNALIWHYLQNDKITSTRSSQRHRITSLEYEINPKDGSHCLTIWADDRYDLGLEDALTAPELQWLASELNNWLGLPIQSTTLLDSSELNLAVTAPEPIKKPKDSNVVLLKRLGWIDVLIPHTTTQDNDLDGEAYTRLYIDNQHIQTVHPAQNDQPPSLRLAINALEYHNSESEFEGALRVWAGSRYYELGGDGSLTRAELRWLAYELSVWLRLPIQHN